MLMNFSRVMRQLALRHGDRPAIVNVERNRRYSYREFHELTNRIAAVLRTTLQVGTGDKFLLILENDNLSLLHFAAIFKQEGTAVFTNYRDKLEEHQWQVELVKPKAVLVENALLASHHGMLRAHGCTIVAMDRQPDLPPGVLCLPDLLEQVSGDDNDCELDVHRHVPLLRFTGGTTGRGKCAMYSIDNLLGARDTALINTDFAISEQTRCLHFAPLSHGTLLLYIPTLFMGGVTVTQNAPDMERWLQVVEDERITHSFLVPTLLYRLLDLQGARARDLSSLRSIVYGAAPMNPTRLAGLVACFGPVFVQGYAATEVSMFVASLGKQAHTGGDDGMAGKLASAGRVTPGVEVFIADDAGRPLPVGATGEIMIRGRSVILGYYANPEGTAAEFINGAWKSGDIGYLDGEGYLHIVDRKKDMIITGGFNVYAVEVEAALGSHPAVLMSAVVGIPHAEWGEAVHAEVMLREGSSVTEAELIEHAKKSLGGYKAPKSVTFAGQLPVSVVGKVLRRMVRDKYWQGQGRNIA